MVDGGSCCEEQHESRSVYGHAIGSIRESCHGAKSTTSRCARQNLPSSIVCGGVHIGFQMVASPNDVCV